MAQFEPPLPIPPVNPAASRDGWARMGEALMNAARGEIPSPAIDAYARMATAFRQDRVADFNSALNDYVDDPEGGLPAGAREGLARAVFQ